MNLRSSLPTFKVRRRRQSFVQFHSLLELFRTHLTFYTTLPTYHIALVPGYKPRMLAVRSIKGISSARIFRLHLFWFFTFLGLTVPYRIWFKRHCDALRVIVVKETLAVPPSTSYWDTARQWIPYTTTTGRTITAAAATATSTVKPRSRHDTHFRNFMKGQSLYRDESSIPSSPTRTMDPPDTSRVTTQDQSTLDSPASNQ